MLKIEYHKATDDSLEEQNSSHKYELHEVCFKLYFSRIISNSYTILWSILEEQQNSLHLFIRILSMSKIW